MLIELAAVSALGFYTAICCQGGNPMLKKLFRWIRPASADAVSGPAVAWWLQRDDRASGDRA